jgi:hypothetical protein
MQYAINPKIEAETEIAFSLFPKPKKAQTLKCLSPVAASLDLNLFLLPKAKASGVQQGEKKRARASS